MTSTTAPPPTGQIPVIAYEPSLEDAEQAPDSARDGDLAALIAGHLEALRSRGADQAVLDLLAAELSGMKPADQDRRSA